MHQHYHQAITEQALGGFFRPAALQTILRANLRQDRLAGQIGHPEYHFDDSAFAQGRAYIEAQRQAVYQRLAAREVRPAWEAFGRLVHAAQDFYAHSNYARLWLELHAGAGPMPLDPVHIDPLDPQVLGHGELVSGRNYLALEILALLPGLRGAIEQLSPYDSHLRRNLDTPARGPLFPYALAAAEKRTRWEYERLLAKLPAPQAHLFHQGE